MYRNFWSNMHIILKLKSLIKSKHLLYIILNKNKLRSITLVKKTYEIRFKLLRPANDSYTIRNFHRKTFPNTKKPSNEKNQIPSKNKQLSFHSTLSAVSHFIHTNVIALESSSEKLTRFFVTFDEREPVDPGLAVSWTRLSSVSSIFERSSRKKSNRIESSRFFGRFRSAVWVCVHSDSFLIWTVWNSKIFIIIILLRLNIN